MLYHATELIYNSLHTKNEGLKVFKEENENNSRVWLQFRVDNGGNYRIQFVSTDNDNDVAVRVFTLLHIEEDKKSAVLSAISEINRKYRYVKFNIDGDNDVNVAYDFPIHMPDDALGECALETVVRFVKIIDQAYPILMKALYS